MLYVSQSCNIIVAEVERDEEELLKFADMYESPNALFAYGEIDPLELHI